MSNHLAKPATFIFIFLLFQSFNFGQEPQSPESYLSLAQSHEKIKAYKLAADNYMLTGKAFEEKAKTYTTSGAVKNNLTAARDAYSKARDNYKNAKEADKEKDALQQAVRVGLLLGQKNVEEKNKEREDAKAQIKQLPWKPGKTIILDARQVDFSITMPEGVKFTGPRVFTGANHAMLRESETSVQVVGQNADPRFSFSLKEHIDDNKSNHSISDYCDRQAKLYGSLEKNPAMGLTGLKDTEVKQVNIGAGVQACLVTKSSQQMDTKKFMFGFEMLFYYKKNSYTLIGIGPYGWKDAIEQMLKTFHITGEEPEPEDPNTCTGNGTKDVHSLAFEDVWMVPDPKGTLRITLSPNLPRRAVPAEWHDIINITREAVQQIEGLMEKFETREEKAKELEVLEFVVNTLEIPQISPGQLADAYLQVFDKMITAISSLEGRISNMAVDLSFELPYKEVKTRCIPRFKCVNEKWQPDYSDMSFQTVSESSRVDRKQYLSLSPGQLQQKLSEINALPEKLKANGEKVQQQECGQHRYKLHDIKWPEHAANCNLIEGKIKTFREQLGKATTEHTGLKKELSDFTKTKTDRINTLKLNLTKRKTELKTKQTQLTQALAERKNYETNQANMPPDQYDAAIKKVNEKILNLERATAPLQADVNNMTEELKYLQSGRAEEILKDQVESAAGEIARLDNEIKIAEAQLKRCRDNEKAFK
jgi:hypothetical protein